jgi:hypothetical protein
MWRGNGHLWSIRKCVQLCHSQCHSSVLGGKPQIAGRLLGLASTPPTPHSVEDVLLSLENHNFDKGHRSLLCKECYFHPPTVYKVNLEDIEDERGMSLSLQPFFSS